MPKEYHVEPVTRLEGHGGLKLTLSDDGKKVLDAQFNVTTTRFFEKFVEGRFMEHVPRITPRICGICPIPHHIAPSKAVEDAWGVKIPPAASKVRNLLMQAKQYSSHLLHFYALAAPDFIYGPFADPARRNVVSILNDLPAEGKMALEMMEYGQALCAAIGGKSVHPIVSIPGGLKQPFSEEHRDFFLKGLEQQIEYTLKTVDIAMKVVTDYFDVIANVGVLPTWYLGVAKENGDHDIYDGMLSICSPDGKIEQFKPQDYLDVIGEHVTSHNYGTHTFIKKAGYPDGVYQTGPLGMLNVCERMNTPLANDAFKKMQETLGKPTPHVFAFHYARIIETVAAIENIATLLKDPDIVSTDIKTMDVEPRAGRGVGMVEAPRGTLIYDLTSDEKGICKKANLLVATNHNLGGIDKLVTHVAKQVVEQDALSKIKLPDPWVK
ncbi:MAG: Ni/Fe hydrogenase subunit alpha [Promethearchaeota archaeon]|nr:MAG: Ni/Fe hydrogenase subunit alpha [Candidatus Lokiarchaeota archaeon]